MIDTKKLREWAAESENANQLDRALKSVFDELDRVTAERDALKVDADRYQYLVATCNIGYEPSEPWQLVIWEPNTGENRKDKLDAAIDAAIRASKGDA